MKYSLPLVLVLVICLAPRSLVAQTPSAMKILPLGQLSGPILRQMAAAACGPFFTINPMDAKGGGMLNLAVKTAEEDVAVVTLHVKAVHVKFCDSCETPVFAQSADASSARGDLSISHEHWKISPCLKSAKVSKR